MKTKVLIPRHKGFPKIRKRTVRVHQAKEEIMELRKLKGYDNQKVARMVNLTFTLSDIIVGLAMDIEGEIRKGDPSLSLPLRHPIERIKEHASAMVRFVDKTLEFDTAISFGELSDKIGKELYKSFEITN